MIAPASILLVASASAAPPGRLAVVALDFTYPHASFRLTLYSTGGRAQTTLVRASASSPLTRVAAPAWSADGRLLYFTGSGPEHEGERFHYLDSDVYAVDPASRRVRRLTHTRDAANA